MRGVRWSSWICVAALGCAGGAGDSGNIVVVGGSSSLYPLSEAVVEDFAALHPGSRIVVGVSGTSGGLRRFCEGEVHIAGASRAMTAAEASRCRAASIGYISLPVVRDGIAVVANPANTGVECLTMAELQRIWEPRSVIAEWRDLRPSLPSEPIRLFGPGRNSGTSLFFTSVVVGRPGASRTDHYQTEDDHLIARGVAGSRWALGYYSLASDVASGRRVRTLGVGSGVGCIRPTPTTIADGSYAPLARELRIFVRRSYNGFEESHWLAAHYLRASGRLAAELGYAPLPAPEYERGLRLLADSGAVSP